MAGPPKSLVLAYLYLWLCLCFYKTFADVIPQIRVNDWTHCDVSENAFLTKWKLSVKTCLLECAKRKRCKALNFMRGIKKCQLLETDYDEIYVDSIWCMHFKKADNTAIHSVPSQCASCPAGLVCDLSSGSCLHKECELFSVAHGTVVGNMNSVGSTVMTIPKTGYTLGEQSPKSVCLSNGTWDNIPVPKIDCGQPPILTHALIIEGDTVYGTTRYYVCDIGYDVTPSSANPSIACGSDGEWSHPEYFECINSDPCFTEWQSMQQTGIHYRAVLCMMNYEDATAYCLSLDPESHLAYVKTAQEYSTLKQYLTDNFDTGLFHSWWIGISMGNSGWVYTGTQTPITFTSWSGGQGSGATGQCVETTFKLNNWNDALCHKGKHPICEIREVT